MEWMRDVGELSAWLFVSGHSHISQIAQTSDYYELWTTILFYVLLSMMPCVQTTDSRALRANEKWNEKVFLRNSCVGHACDEFGQFSSCVTDQET